MKYQIPWELFDHLKNGNIPYLESGKHMNYLVEVNDSAGEIHLHFQQTHGILDWIYNFRFLAYPSRSVVYKDQESCLLAHVGYVKMYKSCNDEIMTSFIDKVHMYPDFSYYINGWSLGGGPSLLAAEDFNYRTRSSKSSVDSGLKAGVDTFGSPKILVGKDCRDYVTSTMSYCHQWAQNNDIVSKMVPFSNYYFAKDALINIGSDKKVKELLNPKKYHTEYNKKELYPEGCIAS